MGLGNLISLDVKKRKERLEDGLQMKRMEFLCILEKESLSSNSRSCWTEESRRALHCQCPVEEVYGSLTFPVEVYTSFPKTPSMTKLWFQTHSSAVRARGSWRNESLWRWSLPQPSTQCVQGLHGHKGWGEGVLTSNTVRERPKQKEP